MRPSVTLLMAIHCHQPVGNLPSVFEEAYAKAYEPFLRALERHPGVRLALHYSGSLLDWLVAQQPEFLERVRALVARGQVELLASGYYEPILPVIPEADRQGQIAKMRDALRAHFGAEATGLWLTERVWEPELPTTLASAHIRYTMVDTNQFAAARPWLPRGLQVQDRAFWDLLGCYATDHAGASVLLFPASRRLRYTMPFAPVEQTIGFLNRLRRAEPVAITFADDGEKFGLWPSTHRWVYEEGWLDRLFTRLEAERDWLTTTTFHEYAEEVGPSGQAYLPCGSYEEMLEWSGGNFRNFFTKYPEANAMQQRMLRVSRAVAELRAESSSGDTLLRQAEQELYQGQCNCPYWHGVFGGLYLSHLRRAVHAHLIAAETLARQASGRPSAVTTLDADGDGLDEVALRTDTMGLLIDPAEGGAVTEWDLFGRRINLIDTLSRRPEPYHNKLRAKRARAAIHAGGGPPNIHDVLGVKEPHLGSHLVYDDHRRSVFLDYGLERMPTLQEVVRSTWTERQVWSGGLFQLIPEDAPRETGILSATMVRDLLGGRIRKTVRVDEHRPALECRYELERLDVPVVGLEFNLSLRDARYLAKAEQYGEAASFTIEEPAIGVSVRLAFDPPTSLLLAPVETVSESEEGLERTYQGLSLVCLWARAPRGRDGGTGGWSGRVRLEVQTRPSTPPQSEVWGRGRSGQSRAGVEGRR